MKKSINLIVQLEENNLRVDVFINKRENLISRTRIKNLILKNSNCFLVKLKSNNHNDNRKIINKNTTYLIDFLIIKLIF